MASVMVSAAISGLALEVALVDVSLTAASGVGAVVISRVTSVAISEDMSSASIRVSGLVSVVVSVVVSVSTLASVVRSVVTAGAESVVVTDV